MSANDRETDEVVPDAQEGVGTDRARRKLTTAGLAGAGILMTMSSRSALGGGFGQCGSESVSAALSRHGELADCGCSPGFWWRSPHGRTKWDDPDIIPPIYGRAQKFNDVFGVQFFKPGKDKTLWELGPGPGSFQGAHTNVTCNGNAPNNLHAICFHAVAALLNASFYGSRYPGFEHPQDVIDAFADAFNSFDQCASLEAFKDAADRYDEGLWCFNGISSSEDWTPY